MRNFLTAFGRHGLVSRLWAVPLAAMVLSCGVSTTGAGTAPSGEVPARATAKSAGAWYSVQLHAHSTHSDGVFTIPQLIAQAKKEGLDALAVSDHDTTTQWLDPALVAEKVLVMLRSEEARDDNEFNHMGLHGMTGTAPIVKLPRAAGLQEATDRKGTIIANHPANRFVPWKPLEADPRVHAIEVWNGWFWNPLLNRDELFDESEEAISQNERAVAWWAELQARGIRVSPIAASDFHRKPQNIASPCTLVWAQDKSEAAILAGIRAGRTLLAKHPRAQRVELMADPAGDGAFAALPGDTVAAASRFRVRVHNAKGDTVRILAGKREVLKAKVSSADWQQELTVPAARDGGQAFVYARLDSGPARQMHGMTGAIYLK